ncbi:hypothetical protein GMRT_13562 [Giardia muris]|uniref:Uncharacterized protein n=1 Tax=Giardia muris TaxID=5742 RepID=A0A4Z1SVU9_GIAMU|nr:hypothetical protein GMRT_13562 [Giardia muris]|eukprot:TNJ29982.1 hypothetical protein GMRT_13562 [Giardia muris]
MPSSRRLFAPPRAMLLHLNALETEVDALKGEVDQLEAFAKSALFLSLGALRDVMRAKESQHFMTDQQRNIQTIRTELTGSQAEVRKVATETLLKVTDIHTLFRADVARFTDTRNGMRQSADVLDELKKGLDSLRQNLISGAKKDAEEAVNLREVARAALTSISGCGGRLLLTETKLEAMGDELRSASLQANGLIDTCAQKLASVRTQYDDCEFLSKERILQYSETRILAKLNDICYSKLLHRWSPKEELALLQAKILKFSSEVRDLELEHTKMMSTMREDLSENVVTFLKHEVEEKLGRAIRQRHNHMLEELQSIGDDLKMAFDEFQQREKLIDSLKQKLDDMRERWAEDIKGLRHRFLDIEAEALKREYSDLLPRDVQLAAISTCRESGMLHESVTNAILMWKQLMERRVEAEKARIDKIEGILNQELLKAITTTQARSLTVDKLGRAFTADVCQLSYQIQTKVDWESFNVQLSRKLNKSDTEMAVAIYCPEEHGEKVIPRPAKLLAVQELSNDKVSEYRPANETLDPPSQLTALYTEDDQPDIPPPNPPKTKRARPSHYAKLLQLLQSNTKEAKLLDEYVRQTQEQISKAASLAQSQAKPPVAPEQQQPQHITSIKPPTPKRGTFIRHTHGTSDGPSEGRFDNVVVTGMSITATPKRATSQKVGQQFLISETPKYVNTPTAHQQRSNSERPRPSSGARPIINTPQRFQLTKETSAHSKTTGNLGRYLIFGENASERSTPGKKIWSRTPSFGRLGSDGIMNLSGLLD